LGHLVAWALDSAVDSLSVAAPAEHVAGLQKLLPPSPRADDAEPPSGVGAQTAELGTNRARAETARTAAESSAVVLTRNPVRARQPPAAAATAAAGGGSSVGHLPGAAHRAGECHTHSRTSCLVRRASALTTSPQLTRQSLH
jgi:hypothetical protein